MENISLELLKKDDIKSWLRFTYLSNPVEFIETFRKIGIIIDSEQDLKNLEELYINRDDLKGTIKSEITGKPVKFDLLETLKNIRLKKSDLVSSKFLIIP